MLAAAIQGSQPPRLERICKTVNVTLIHPKTRTWAPLQKLTGAYLPAPSFTDKNVSPNTAAGAECVFSALENEPQLGGTPAIALPSV